MNLSEVEKFLDDWPNNGEMTPQERIKRLGEILDAYSDSSLMPIGYNRAAVMLFIQKDTARLPNRVQITIPYGGVFQGYDIKVVCRATGRPFRFEFFYGGEKYPDDEGHGHVVCNDEEGNVIYWKLPIREGGYVVIDERDGGEPIRF